MLKKKHILEVGGYDEQYAFASDYALWRTLIKNDFKITTLPKILIAIREHANSISKSNIYRRDIEEAKEIVRRNINRYINTELSDREIDLFFRANYEEGDLTAIEFNEAVKATKKVYNNFTLFPKINRQKIIQWTRKCCLNIYVKRFFSLINQKDYSSARDLSLMAIKQFGPFSIFVFLWGMSLFGGVVLNRIPEFYNEFLRQKACARLGIQRDMKAFH